MLTGAAGASRGAGAAGGSGIGGGAPNPVTVPGGKTGAPLRAAGGAGVLPPGVAPAPIGGAARAVGGAPSIRIAALGRGGSDLATGPGAL